MFKNKNSSVLFGVSYKVIILMNLFELSSEIIRMKLIFILYFFQAYRKNYFIVTRKEKSFFSCDSDYFDIIFRKYRKLIKILPKRCRQKKGKFDEFVYLQFEKQNQRFY